MGITALGAILLFFHDLFTQCHYFRIREIVITGEHHLDQDTIRTQTQIRDGANLLAINLRHVRLRLTAHPWILKADLARDLPGRLVIHVTEEEPFAIVEWGKEAKTACLLTDTGRVFKEIAPGDPQDLPVITGLSYPDLALGMDGPFAGIRTLMEAMPTIGEISQGRFGIRHDPDLGITLEHTPVAETIHFGFSDYRIKIKRLRTLLKHRRATGEKTPIGTIDLIRPDRVVVTPAVLSAAGPTRRDE